MPSHRVMSRNNIFFSILREVGRTWELKVKTCKMPFKNIQAFWFPSYAPNKNLIYIIILFINFFIYFFIIKNNFILNFIVLLFIGYSIFILFFFNYLYKNKNKNFITKPEYISILKDKDFMLFKINLFNIYYSSIIILFIFLIKYKILYYLADFNIYSIYFLFILFIFYLLLISNFFIFKLFKFYKLFLNCINILNTINLEPLNFFNKTNNPVNLCYQSRCFSTCSSKNINKDNSTNVQELDYENTDNLDLELGLSYEKAKELKEFHTQFDVWSGFYGYSEINNLGSYSEFEDLTYNSDTINKNLQKFLDTIPGNKIYTILPLIRFEIPGADSSTLTLTKAIKVTKHTSVKLLGIKILQLIKNKFTLYNLEPQAIDLFIMGRPWLSEADFNVPMNLINEVLEKNLNTEIDINSFYFNKFDTFGSNKKEKIKKYLYDNIYFDRYGEPIFDPSTKDIIGYKLNQNEHAMVHKFYDNKNQKCIKVDITEFNFDTNAFGKEIILSWLDTETENGFTRELEGIKYFHNKENQVFNVEKKYNFDSFPLQNKSKILNTKIGTIDLETFGSNSGLGYHQVYAGGWAIKNKTQLFYLKPKETGEQLINRIFLDILTQKELNGYTFYVHNLGRFDSIFIIRSLVSNKNFKLTPIWKDTGILTITIE